MVSPGLPYPLADPPSPLTHPPSPTWNMPKIVKSWNDFMEVNVGFIMTWGMSETKTRNWSAKFIPEH